MISRGVQRLINPAEAITSRTSVVVRFGSFVTATHDFVPEEDDELEFKKGDRLEVVEIIGPGWLMAKRKDGKRNFV